MSKLPTALDLRRNSNRWPARGVIPPEAAAMRRRQAEMAPKAADWHNAFADQWDQIARDHPEKVVLAYQKRLEYEINCLAQQEPGSSLARYWQDRAAETDRLILALNPEIGK